MRKLNVGDVVVTNGNYRDEQLGQFAPSCNQVIIETMDVLEENGDPLYGTSGQWVKTDKELDWIDSAWFDVAIE